MMDYKLVCFGVDYVPKFRHPRLEATSFSSEGYAHAWYMKPEALLKTVETGVEEFVYLDVDYICGRRFSVNMFDKAMSYPLGVPSAWKVMNKWHTDAGGVRHDYSDVALFSYFNLPAWDRSVWYTRADLLSVSAECEDFLHEWVALCRNKYLTDRSELYVPFPDETMYNVVLNRRRCTQQLKRVSINAFVFEVFNEVELKDDLSGEVLRHDSVCDSSYMVGLYHAIKDEGDLSRCLEVLEREAKG